MTGSTDARLHQVGGAPGGVETLAAAFASRRNSLNTLRLFLAVLVIVSHSWPIARGLGDPTFLGVSLGAWAVMGFFSVSGFLIYGSATRNHTTRYLMARVRRIYPGYVVAILAVAFVFAPLSTLLTPGQYRLGDGLRFVAWNSLLYLKQGTVGTTLGQAPLPGNWNGSLWTLWYEFVWYLIAAALAALTFRSRWSGRYVVGAAFVATSMVLTVTDQLHLPIRPHQLGALLDLGVFFLGGALLRAVADRVRLSGTLAVVSACAVLLPAWLPLLSALRPLALPYLCLWLSLTIPQTPWLDRHDYSYGTYIYAFPIQQLVVAASPLALSPWGLATLSVAATLPVAMLSWHLVERRFLPSKSPRGCG